MVADTYSSTLGTLVMGTGNDNNTWGTNANSAVFQILEDAIANILTITDTSGTKDLSGTPPPAAASAARYWQLNCTGVLVGNLTIQVPNLSKGWLVNNACTLGAFSLKMKTPAGTAVTIPAGWGYVWCDGANVINVSPYFSLSLTLPSQTLAPNGSAGAPSYSFTNEPTTGVYLTAGHLNLAQGGVKVLDLASGAAILTGTLAVSSTSAFTGAATFTGAANLNGGGTISGTFTGGATFSGDIVFSSTDWTQLASGTTGQQPAAGAGGRVRWNSSTSRLTLDYGAAWNNMLTSAEFSSLAQAQAGTDNTTVMTPIRVQDAAYLAGYQRQFTNAVTGWTRHASANTYSYSHTVAPTTAVDYTTDDTTAITYTAKYATSILEFDYNFATTANQDYLAGQYVACLLQDSTIVDWQLVHDNVGSLGDYEFHRFSFAVGDTSSHVYKFVFLYHNSTGTWNNNPGRRTLIMRELRVG